MVMNHQHVMTLQNNKLSHMPAAPLADRIATPASLRGLVSDNSAGSHPAVLASAVERATLLVQIQNQTLYRLRSQLAMHQKVIEGRNTFAKKINYRYAESKRKGGMDFVLQHWKKAAQDMKTGNVKAPPGMSSLQLQWRQQEEEEEKEKEQQQQQEQGVSAQSRYAEAAPDADARDSEGRASASAIEGRTNNNALRFAHVVNFLPRGIGHSDQEVTVQSMVNAKAFADERAAAGEDTPVVELYSAEFADDHATRVRRDTAIIKEAPNLARHVYDLYNLKRFEQIKFQKLPLLSDIFQSAIEASDAPYIVYSNADIGLQPHFYVEVAKYLTEGVGRSALAINRVEIPTDDDHNSKLGRKDMEEIYALGKKHRQNHKGYDCFVFHRNVVPFLQLFLRSAFIGYPPIGSKMNDALQCVADYYVVRGKHLTFHLGVKNGGWGEDSEFEFYNRKAVKHSEAEFSTFMRALGGGAACATAKEAAKDAESKVSMRVKEEVTQRSFVFPKYPKLPDWEKEYAKNITLRANAAAASHTAAALADAPVDPSCSDPQSARPQSPVRKLIMASSGRVGSTVLAQVLGHHGIQVDHTHFSVDRIISDQQKAGTTTPVLFIFGDPVDVVLSLRQRDIDTGDSFFGKNISWVRKHLENMEQDHLFEAWAKRDYFKTDVLQLEQQFKTWHQPMPFPFMSLRYETERQNLDKLAAFLGTKKSIVLPALGPGRPIAGSKGKVPREERFKRLEVVQQEQMMQTYGALQTRIKNAPDACIWQKK